MEERYICTECGKDFDLSNVKYYTESHGFTDGRFETLSCCPYCGGGYMEAVVCEHCGNAFSEDDKNMFGSWCKECLLEAVNYETFRQYLLEDWRDFGDVAVTDLEWFIFRDVWGVNDSFLSKIDFYSSEYCKRDLLALYDAYVALDAIGYQSNKEHPFLDKIKSFVSEDLSVWEDWLVKYLEKNKNCGG